MDLQAELRKAAARLLADDAVDVVIGYEDAGVPMSTTPCFIRKADQVDRLVWNQFCQANLAKYLVGRKDRVAVVAKACDTRSIVVLLTENQLEREKIKVIGMPCGEIIDRKKIEAHLKGAEVTEATLDDGVINVKGNEFEEELKADDFRADCCLNCSQRDPVINDVPIGEGPAKHKPQDQDSKIEQLESMSAEQRWEYFKKELGKCIRCYACRDACPLCYCKNCLVDQNFPAWLGKSIDISDTIAFHIMRAIHTAGRCVDCGACVRACPNNIDLRLITGKVAMDVKELFGEQAGDKPDWQAPMASYDEKDPEDFIK